MTHVHSERKYSDQGQCVAKRSQLLTKESGSLRIFKVHLYIYI